MSELVVPPRMARLPVDKHARLVPWFVAWIDGQPDHRVVGEGRLEDAVRFRKCWLCGGTLGANAAFVVGSMCGVNRTSAEPPSHRDCALYAVRACPFMVTPRMRRRESGLPDGVREPDGIMIRRNPGVALVWVSRSWSVWPDLRLFALGDPVETSWWCEGRVASRLEVWESVESGLPLLRVEAEGNVRPAAAVRALERQVEVFMPLLPAA